MHTERREQGELSVERFGELWAETQAEMLGDAVEITEGYRTWWSYIPHFIGTPGYVYAYAYGQLLALVGVPRRTRSAATSSCPVPRAARGRRLALARGARARSSASTSPIPAFWDGGLAIVDEQLDAAEAARRPLPAGSPITPMDSLEQLLDGSRLAEAGQLARELVEAHRAEVERVAVERLEVEAVRRRAGVRRRAPPSQTRSPTL